MNYEKQYNPKYPKLKLISKIKYFKKQKKIVKEKYPTLYKCSFVYSFIFLITVFAFAISKYTSILQLLFYFIFAFLFSYINYISFLWLIVFNNYKQRNNSL